MIYISSQPWGTSCSQYSLTLTKSMLYPIDILFWWQDVWDQAEGEQSKYVIPSRDSLHVHVTNIEHQDCIFFWFQTPKLSELKSSVDDDDDSRTSFVDIDNDQVGVKTL